MTTVVNVFSAEQETYIAAKALYDAAVAAEDWTLAERLEDAYLDAEAALVEWAIGRARETGRIAEGEIETLREHWRMPQYTERVVSLAMMMPVA